MEKVGDPVFLRRPTGIGERGGVVLIRTVNWESASLCLSAGSKARLSFSIFSSRKVGVLAK